MADVSVLGLQKMGYLGQPLRKAGGCGCGRPAFDRWSPVDLSWRVWRNPTRRRTFREQAAGSALFLGKWMALAFFVESLMIAYLPAASVAAFVGMENAAAGAVSSIPAAMAVYAVVKRSVFLLYIALGLIGSMAAGYLYQLFSLG